MRLLNSIALAAEVIADRNTETNPYLSYGRIIAETSAVTLERSARCEGTQVLAA